MEEVYCNVKLKLLIMKNVGFYGRCVLHAIQVMCGSDRDFLSTDTVCAGKKNWPVLGQRCIFHSSRFSWCCTWKSKDSTCNFFTLFEGYNGRKQEGFWHNCNGQSNGKGGCLVPQEQLNAWIHINGQKSCKMGVQKLSISDLEYDCRVRESSFILLENDWSFNYLNGFIHRFN